jgi:hypothetical protein
LEARLGRSSENLSHKQTMKTKVGGVAQVVENERRRTRLRVVRAQFLSGSNVF